MANAVTIRSYQSSDYDRVVRLWEDAFPDEPSYNDFAEVIARKLRVQPDMFYVASISGSVVGTVLVGYDGVRGWVHKLAVAKSCRRMGIATLLMQQAETGLRTLGCPKLNLQVRSSNSDVIGFYQALGYAVQDRASLGKPLL
ncbi:MAG: GNAT family acetyltransferase [Pseudomonadota bacterium]